jgi:hypothetical protein
MYITIEPTQQLVDTNNNFQKFFGLLRLDFYASVHNSGELSTELEALDYETTWSELGLKSEHKIEFEKSTSVSEFEGKFKALGFGVQVMRNSKGVWLQTSATDDWSLAEQQARAEEMSGHVQDEREVGDYHEQE